MNGPDLTSKSQMFLRYLMPLFVIFGIVLGALILVMVAEKVGAPDLLNKINTRSIAILLCCVGVYVGSVLVFENFTEALKVEAKDASKRGVTVSSKSVGGVVIIVSLVIACVITVAEIQSSQSISCGEKKWTFDKFVRSEDWTKTVIQLCNPRQTEKLTPPSTNIP